MDVGEIRSSYKVLEKGSYLMNAAVGAIHKDVLRASQSVWDFMCEYGDIHEEKYFEMIESTIDTVSNHLNLLSEDIAFNANTSHNMNLIAMILKEKNLKREIIIPSNEFPSSLIPFHHHGFSLKMVEPKNSRIMIEDIISKITDQTSAVVISAVSFLTGFRIDLIELGRELDKRDIPFIVNGTQMLGAFKIPFKEAKIKAFCASVHKWYCAGFGMSLFMTSEEFREGVKWPLAGWTSVEDPSKMSTSELILRKETSASQTGCVAFDNFMAIREAAKVIEKYGQDFISKEIINISSYMVDRLKELPVVINSYRDDVNACSGTVNFSPRDTNIKIHEVVKLLHNDKVYINDRKNSFRASAHFYNNREDIDKMILCLKEYL